MGITNIGKTAGKTEDEGYVVRGVKIRSDLYHKLLRKLHADGWTFREWMEMAMCDALGVEYVDGVSGLGKDDPR